MVRVGRLAVLGLAALLLPVASSNGTSGSGLYGTVRKGPIMPVCQQGVPCDAPAQVTLIFTRSTDEVSRARATSSGRYRIALRPGFYTVQAATKVGVSRSPKPHAVHVRAGYWDRINLFFDTGIR